MDDELKTSKYDLFRVINKNHNNDLFSELC